VRKPGVRTHDEGEGRLPRCMEGGSEGVTPSETDASTDATAGRARRSYSLTARNTSPRFCRGVRHVPGSDAGSRSGVCPGKGILGRDAGPASPAAGRGRSAGASSTWLTTRWSGQCWRSNPRRRVRRGRCRMRARGHGAGPRSRDGRPARMLRAAHGRSCGHPSLRWRAGRPATAPLELTVVLPADVDDAGAALELPAAADVGGLDVEDQATSVQRRVEP
jgi:hypothetical protein